MKFSPARSFQSEAIRWRLNMKKAFGETGYRRVSGTHDLEVLVSRGNRIL